MSAIDGKCPTRGRTHHAKWIIPVGVSACYALFAVAVQLRLFDALDLAVREAARPGDLWGIVQIRAARVASALQPTHMALALVLGVAVVSLLRRSLRPFAVAAAVGVPAVIATLVSKWVMAQSDRGATPVDHSGFPSGHTVGVAVVSGLLVLLVRPGTRWGWALPVLLGALMGSVLILAGIHPATDVVGAGLLTVAALSGAQAAGLAQWAYRSDREVVR